MIITCNFSFFSPPTEQEASVTIAVFYNFVTMHSEGSLTLCIWWVNWTVMFDPSQVPSGLMNHTLKNRIILSDSTHPPKTFAIWQGIHLVGKINLKLPQKQKENLTQLCPTWVTSGYIATLKETGALPFFSVWFW